MSLPRSVLRQHLLSIAHAGLRAVSAEQLTARVVSDIPALREASRAGRLVLIAAGKPASAMVRGFLKAGLTPARGMIATTHVAGDGEARELPDSLRLFLAGHPVPTSESVAAGQHALALAREAAPEDHLVVLLSGGASALLAAPADGLTLDDKMCATRALLGGGAAIHELNAVRKHLSAIKGGRLAAAARCAVQTFALSDVISPVDDDPGVIGSGPTVADATTFAEALAVIDRLGVRAAMPPAVLACLEGGAATGRGAGQESAGGAGCTESPKPGDPRLARAEFRVIGSRRDAMTGARDEAERLGFRVFVVEEAVAGEARDAAPRLLAHARGLAAGARTASAPASEAGPDAASDAVRDVAARPCCIIASGETTVRVTGTGRGGRNQEFALALADVIAGAEPTIVAASIGTDGIDGPTDAAGGIVDSETISRARAAGIGEPGAFLANNDAYRFLDAVGDVIKTGPTDTNVGDLQIILTG